jgi:hypothetical protein
MSDKLLKTGVIHDADNLTITLDRSKSRYWILEWWFDGKKSKRNTRAYEEYVNAIVHVDELIETHTKGRKA